MRPLDPEAPGLSPAEARRVRRRAWLLAELGHPQASLPRVMTVAGTNGKGSTVAFLEAIARAAGLRVASFTSPDLHGPHERFRLPEGGMGPEAYRAWMERLQPWVAAAEARFPEAGPMGAFERWALVAWLAMAEARPELALVEAGVGGRGDATDVFLAPVATLFTAVGEDHLERLGGDLASVIAHKAGLMRPAVPALISWSGLGGSGLLAQAQAGGAIGEAVEAWPSRPPLGARGGPWEARSPWGWWALGLGGAHQGANAALAAAAIPHLRAAGLAIPKEALAGGLAQASWPGRLEWVQDPIDGGWWCLDVAHNPPAAAALAASWGAVGVVALAVQAEKDLPGLLAHLQGPPWLLAPVPGLPEAKSWSLSQEALKPWRLAGQSVGGATEALALARRLAPTRPRVATGSVYWVAAVREALGLAPPCDPAWREAKPGGFAHHGP